MEILKDQKQGLSPPRPDEEVAHAVKRIPPFLLRGQLRWQLDIRQHAAQLRDQLGNLWGGLAQGSTQGFRRSQSANFLQHLNERYVGRGARHFVAASGEGQHTEV